MVCKIYKCVTASVSIISKSSLLKCTRIFDFSTRALILFGTHGALIFKQNMIATSLRFIILANGP